MTHEELAYALSCGATLDLGEGLKMARVEDRAAIKSLAEFMHCFEDLKRDLRLIKEISSANGGPAGGVMMYANDTRAWCFWLVIDIRSDGGKLTEMRAVIVLSEKILEQLGRSMAKQTVDFLRDRVKDKQNLQVVEDFQAWCE